MGEAGHPQVSSDGFLVLLENVEGPFSEVSQTVVWDSPSMIHWRAEKTVRYPSLIFFPGPAPWLLSPPFPSDLRAASSTARLERRTEN